jgi:hypothetical protein
MSQEINSQEDQKGPSHDRYIQQPERLLSNPRQTAGPKQETKNCQQAREERGCQSHVKVQELGFDAGLKRKHNMWLLVSIHLRNMVASCARGHVGDNICKCKKNKEKHDVYGLLPALTSRA